MIKLTVLLLVLSLAICEQVIQFEIYKSYANDQNDLDRINIGTL